MNSSRLTLSSIPPYGGEALWFNNKPTTKSLPLSGEETKERVNHKSCKLFVISTIERNLKNSELLKIFLDVSHSFDMTENEKFSISS
jgi:hypothetical protein